jgi:hypothetical protein
MLLCWTLSTTLLCEWRCVFLLAVAVMIEHTNSDTSCARGLQTPAERNYADTT